MQSYQEARSKIRSGHVLGWSHREPWYKSIHAFKIFCIRLFRMTPWTHVGTAWVVADRVFVIEAVEPCVRIFPLSQAGDFGWLNVPAGWHPSTEEGALETVGENYSQLEAIMASYVELDMKSGLWECAKLVAYIAAMDEVDLGKEFTPDAVLERAMEIPGVELVMVKNTRAKT